MKPEAAHLTPSGVLIADDFRTNLIIDRYDPVFADMRASKLKHLRSVNSEDAVTWNVFRTIRQVSPQVWLPLLWQRAFPESEVPRDQSATVRLWENIAPPLGLLVGGDEGDSEVDVVIEAPTWVWFIEAKYRSDISTGTKTRPERDQVLRNIDVGSYYSGVRPFFFSLLILSTEKSPEGVKRIEEYRNLSVPKAKLKAHRLDALENVRGISELKWSAIYEVLVHASEFAPREDERGYVARAVEWLRERGLAGDS